MTNLIEKMVLILDFCLNHYHDEHKYIQFHKHKDLYQRHLSSKLSRMRAVYLCACKLVITRILQIYQITIREGLVPYQ